VVGRRAEPESREPALLLTELCASMERGWIGFENSHVSGSRTPPAGLTGVVAAPHVIVAAGTPARRDTACVRGEPNHSYIPYAHTNPVHMHMHMHMHSHLQTSPPTPPQKSYAKV
jgi:hypothetical protein